MASPVQYSPSSRRCFSPRVLQRLEARLEKIAKERKDSGEWHEYPNNKAREGCDIKESGHGGQVGHGHGHDHISSSNYSSGYRDGDKDSLLVQTSSDESSVHRTSPDHSPPGSPILSRPKEDPNGMQSTTALRGSSLVEGNHPGYFADDAYIRPAASDLEIEENYWVKYDYPAIRALLRVPTEKLPDSHCTFAPLPRTPSYASRRRFREKMEESGYLVRGRRVCCNNNSPERYRFVPIGRFGNPTRRNTKTDKDASAKLGEDVEVDPEAKSDVEVQDVGAEASGKSVDDCVRLNTSLQAEHANFTSKGIGMVKSPASYTTDNTTDDTDSATEWEFVSTWPEAEEAKALLELPTIRGFRRSPLL